MFTAWRVDRFSFYLSSLKGITLPEMNVSGDHLLAIYDWYVLLYKLKPIVIDEPIEAQ